MGHRRHVFLVSLALLLVATCTHAAGGHATQAAAVAITQQGTDDGVVGSMTRRSMVGSSRPSCEGKCAWWCVGRSCETVLVPIEPPKEQNKPQSRRHGSRGGGGDGARASAAQLRRPSPYEDADHTAPEYKPEIWRCKCVGAS